MQLALVANPASGGSTDAEHVAASLRAAGATVSVHDLDAPDAAAAARPDRIVVAGGDGSVGLVAAAAAAAGLPLAVIPTGTANDFARVLDLPLDLDAACALAADPTATTRSMEVARMGERPWVNAASCGLSVIAGRLAAPLKARLGPLAYAAGALRAGVTAHPLACRVLVDGEEAFDGEAWQVIIAASGAFGGGSRLDAVQTDDDRLDVAILPAGPRVALVRRAYGMRAGTLTDQEPVLHLLGRRIEVEGGHPFNVDGELCDDGVSEFHTDGERVAIVLPS